MFRQSSHERNFFKALTVSAAKESHKLRRAFKSCLTILLESVPFLIACAVLVSVISLKSPILLFCLLVGSLIAVITQQIGQQVNLPKRSLILLQILAAAIVLSLYWLDWFAAPAQAQFFGEAEKFFKKTLQSGSGTNASGSDTPVSLIFNVLRAIYLLYIAISLVGVINAVRKDEDWQSIARTPLLVVVAVTIADVLTRFVIGDSSR
ncbi:hypothetical protein CDG76_19995 [Nostoc sp. 'Peltigera membranacea cyanobiont' 210A]|uniref:hypothetical protein n=1 Tax=Nostoc sp. 'Peltigera membranacea cyanobiont' 210A TaxID=2014529 RepID=UPI000B959FF2|nr:hypothetical protein [Nostoc sp. 'Peltigera membranacea cyanobiont' 210A]OYD92988.1 hypothetical protein CDG76_19995 [Nostoc sp. 'Peltigera membranacea cyanobiont' 210A]